MLVSSSDIFMISLHFDELHLLTCIIIIEMMPDLMDFVGSDDSKGITTNLELVTVYTYVDRYLITMSERV